MTAIETIKPQIDRKKGNTYKRAVFFKKARLYSRLTCNAETVLSAYMHATCQIGSLVNKTAIHINQLTS